MFALKDKVSNQLSRLFADSPSNPSSPYSPPDDSQARPSSQGRKSLSSYFSFFAPSVNSADFVSEKNQSGLKPLHSLSVGWSGKDFDRQDENSVRYHECNTICEDEEFRKSCEDKEWSEDCVNKQAKKNHEDDGASESSSSDSDIFEEASEPETPRKPLPLLMNDSEFISPELYKFFQSSLPNIVKGCQWALLYSTLKHGISLRTLIRKSADLSGPCLLIVGDRQGAVFGGLMECPLKPTPKRKYQGTNQSFVFTTIYGEPRLFRPTGANRYYFLCVNDLLALGGGGSFALSLDGDLLNGTSGPCDTFGNLCLAHNTEFELKNVELWGFTHSSKYLT